MSNIDSLSLHTTLGIGGRASKIEYIGSSHELELLFNQKKKKINLPFLY